MEERMSKENLIKKLILNMLISLICALSVSVIITGHLWEIRDIGRNIDNLRVWVFLNRSYLLFFLLFFIGLHFIVPIKKMYEWLFAKRWLVGILLLFFLTANRYHGDSISFYNEYIQPGMGDASSAPIFGRIRHIRTDEYIGTTPSVLASGYGETPYGQYNEVMRGTKTLNAITGVYAGYSTLAYAPWKLSYLILPKEYAFSFCWYAPIIMAFLISMELFYIISKNKKLLAVTGAFLVVGSSFYLWWAFPVYIISAQGTVVCLSYFFNNERFWQKILFGIGTALCFSNFVINLYPAWQVPFGYMFLAVGVWLLHENWDRIKKMSLNEWLIIIGAVCLVASFVLFHFYTIKDYVTTINETAYPGKRVDTGGFSLSKIFIYSQAPFYAYRDVGNASEAGVFFSLFPVPTIMALYCFIREKKKDWLTGGLLLAQLPMLIYVTVGLPEIIAKISLFANSITTRTIDVIGLIQIYFIIIILSRYHDIPKMHKMPALILGIITAGISIGVSIDKYPGYLINIQKILMFGVITGMSICLVIHLEKKIKTLFLYSLIGISLFTGVYVRPVMKGLAAIYSKPAAKEIEKICENDKGAKWIACGGGSALSSFSISCGAPTVNSLNIYPNMELWRKLDPQGEYEGVYNRYAHVDVYFTNEDTNFEILYPDAIRLNLSYKDIEKTEISYLILMGEPDLENEYVEFKEIYKENGLSIYHLSYS